MIRKSDQPRDELGRFTFGARPSKKEMCVKDQHGNVHTVRRGQKTKGGNQVFFAYQKHENEEDDNFDACEVLVDKLGWRCVLLPRSDSHKTADMLNVKDGVFWEIKTTRKGSENSIDRAMERAILQSECMVLRFAVSGINLDWAKDMVQYKNYKHHLKSIVVLTKEGEVGFVYGDC